MSESETNPTRPRADKRSVLAGLGVAALGTDRDAASREAEQSIIAKNPSFMLSPSR
jgi:hypothetical protein